MSDRSLRGMRLGPSMKVPPKRKGNATLKPELRDQRLTLNESPSEKEGKWDNPQAIRGKKPQPSMKVPPKRKGNREGKTQAQIVDDPSMKVPPKRKGNCLHRAHTCGLSPPQ